MPASALTRSGSSELWAPNDSKCATSGRLALTAPCKQPGTQLPMLNGLTCLPARLAKLLTKQHPTRFSQQPSATLLSLGPAETNACSSGEACPAIPSYPGSASSSSSSSSNSSLSTAACSGLQAEHARTQPALEDACCTGSWSAPPALPSHTTASLPPHAPELPSRPTNSHNTSGASTLGTCGDSTPSCVPRPQDRHLPGGTLREARAAPSSPRICMYITEGGCTDLASAWAADHPCAPSPSRAAGTAEALAPHAPGVAAGRSASGSATVSCGALPPRQATLHLPAPRRSSCPDRPQVFDFTAGDVALLECPLVQSLMLNTL